MHLLHNKALELTRLRQNKASADRLNKDTVAIQTS